MNEKTKEAKDFLDKLDEGTKCFNVEWTQVVTWCVAAESKEEALKAAEKVPVKDIYFEEPEVSVSGDLLKSAKSLEKVTGKKVNPPQPDCGVLDGEIFEIDEYIAQRVWKLICDSVGNSMVCGKCGHEDWTSAFNECPGQVVHGHVPVMGCPECEAPIDWRDLVKVEKDEHD